MACATFISSVPGTGGRVVTAYALRTTPCCAFGTVDFRHYSRHGVGVVSRVFAAGVAAVVS